MPHGGGAPTRRRWRSRRSVPGRLRLRLRDRARRPADPLRRLQLLRLPAVVVHLPRPVARGGRRDDCCGGEFPAYTAIIRWPGTRRWVECASDRRRRHAGAVLRRRARADEVDEPLAPTASRSTTSTRPGSPGLFWTIAGLLVLRRLLLRHFTDRVTAATLLTLLLGTNLYHYATFDSVLQPRVLVLSVRRVYRPDRTVARRRRALDAHGAHRRRRRPHHRSPGTRTLLFLVCLPLFGVTDAASLAVAAATAPGRLAHAPRDDGCRRRRRRSRRSWRSTTRQPGARSSAPTAPSDSISRPHGSIGVLFSVQKGLFFWSPLLLLACAGLAWLLRSGIRRGHSSAGGRVPRRSTPT